MSIPFEKMKVAELKILATNYGIKKEEIEGSGKNGRILGTDYVRVLNEYVTKKATSKTKSIKEKSKKAISKTKRKSISDSEKATESEPEEIVKSSKKSPKSGSSMPAKSISKEKTKSFSDSEKTITMEEELIQTIIKKEELRNAFIKCITK